MAFVSFSATPSTKTLSCCNHCNQRQSIDLLTIPTPFFFLIIQGRKNPGTMLQIGVYLVYQARPLTAPDVVGRGRKSPGTRLQIGVYLVYQARPLTAPDVVGRGRKRRLANSVECVLEMAPHCFLFSHNFWFTWGRVSGDEATKVVQKSV